MTSLSDESTDVQYPSAKTVYELIKRLEERIVEQDQFIEDLQNTKIEKENDDYYPKMAVGLADNLAGVDVVDSEVNFRRSGGGAISDGVARIESIKGNSVVWNQQLSPDKNVFSYSEGSFEKGRYAITPIGDVPGITQKVPALPVLGHKYIALCTKSGGTSPLSLNFGGFDTIIDSNPIITVTNTDKIICTFYAYKETEPFTLTIPNLINLTQMFGAGNEPTTIEEFYARLPMGVDMNAYNEGEVIHMDVQSIESVGVNQWDEEWEEGGLSANGLGRGRVRVLSDFFSPLQCYQCV